MIKLLAILFLGSLGQGFASSVYINSGHHLGALAPEPRQRYGSDSFCWVSIRPLYTGEVEGLPLYEIFKKENANLVGYEFRKLYYTEPSHSIPGCTPTDTPSCASPRNYAYEGFSIGLTKRQKFEHKLFRREICK